MDLFEILQTLFQNPKWVGYIIAVQLPIVACLAIQCYQFYKLGFSEFRLISNAWILNLIYLLFNVFVPYIIIEEPFKILIRTSFDLSYMFLFLKAVLVAYQPKLSNSKVDLLILKLKKVNVKLLYFFIACIGIINIIPEFAYDIPINIWYIPSAAFDFFVLWALSKHLRWLEDKFKHIHILSCSIFLYGMIQFFSILKFDETNNIGFICGLILKIVILLFLSRLMVYAVRITEIKEKEDLLKGFSKATNQILDIRTRLFSKNRNKEDIILPLVLDKILLLLKKELGYYSTYNEKAGTFHIAYTSPRYHKLKNIIYASDKSLSGKTIEENSIIILKNSREMLAYKRHDIFNEVNIKVKSCLTIPLEIDGRVLGVYTIECEQENCFSEVDVRIADSLKHQARIALKNNLLIQDIEISKGFLESLKQIDKEIVDERRNLQPVLKFILARALEIVKCESGNIDIVKGEELICVASTTEKNIGERNLIDDCISGLAVVERTTRYIPDISKASSKEKTLYKNRLGHGYKCELVIPLIVNSEVIGIFNTESKITDKFTKDDVNTIEGFAGQAAIAIYITKLIDDITEKNTALENSIDKRNISTIFLYGNLINHRIGNRVGMIRNKIQNKLLYSQRPDIIDDRYGSLNENVIAELKIMLTCAEETLNARKEISEKGMEILMSKPTLIDYSEIKYWIEQNSEFHVNKSVSIEILGFDELNGNIISLELLKEVFIEMITNGIKAMPNGGKIIVSGKSEQTHNVLQFTDNGCGITEEHLTHIFDKGASFWKDGNKGGGIGLFEVKSIILFWGGNIYVESVQEQGTTFTLTIPFTK